MLKTADSVSPLTAYMPIGLMLIALVFRGVAFEFRFKVTSVSDRRIWDQAFHWGS